MQITLTEFMFSYRYYHGCEINQFSGNFRNAKIDFAVKPSTPSFLILDNYLGLAVAD